MKIDFVLFFCLYPVCTSVMQYVIALRYKLHGWEHFNTKKGSKVISFVNFTIWIIISVALYIQ